MREPPMVPTSFSSLGPEGAGRVPIVLRQELRAAEARPILDAISSVGWAKLQPAYGSAADVRDQLVAITVGDDTTRNVAWWNLWGNIHHQGTIYSATIPAVPILASLAASRTFPDRVEAIFFLREIARAPGVVAWDYGTDGEMVYDEEEQAALGRKLAEHIDDAATRLLGSWKTEPAAVESQEDFDEVSGFEEWAYSGS